MPSESLKKKQGEGSLPWVGLNDKKSKVGGYIIRGQELDEEGPKRKQKGKKQTDRSPGSKTKNRILCENDSQCWWVGQGEKR